MISIITVCKNSENTVERTIKSVIDQGYPDLEYIIIDGGSTDNTIEIIKRYEKHISYWISEPDNGISDAFNKGLAIAKGDIIGIINSDDWYEEGSFAKVADIFKNYDVDVLGGKVRYWEGDKPSYVFSSDSRKLHLQMTLNHPAVFARKRCYEKHGGFDTGYDLAMDYELLLRFKERGCKFMDTELVLANMGLGGGSDIRWHEGFRQVREAKIRHLHEPVRAYLYYCFQVFRRYVLYLLKFFCLYGMISFYKSKMSLIKKERQK